MFFLQIVQPNFQEANPTIFLFPNVRKQIICTHRPQEEPVCLFTAYLG